MLTRNVKSLHIHYFDDGMLSHIIVDHVTRPEEDPDNPGMELPFKRAQFQVNEADLSAGNKTSITNILGAMVSLLDAAHPINTGIAPPPRDPTLP